MSNHLELELELEEGISITILTSGRDVEDLMANAEYAPKGVNVCDFRPLDNLSTKTWDKCRELIEERLRDQAEAAADAREDR